MSASKHEVDRREDYDNRQNRRIWCTCGTQFYGALESVEAAFAAHIPAQGTARDTAVTTLAEVLADTASWGSNHGIPVDEYVSKQAGRVVDAIIAAVEDSKLARIREAHQAYEVALSRREHGGVAAAHFIEAVADVLEQR